MRMNEVADRCQEALFHIADALREIPDIPFLPPADTDELTDIRNSALSTAHNHLVDARRALNVASDAVNPHRQHRVLKGESK